MRSYLFIIITLLFFSCQENTTSQSNHASLAESENPQALLLEQIKEKEQKLLKTLDKELDKPTAYELIAKSEAWMNQYPDHEETPEIMFKSADVARGLGDFGLAIKLWEKVYQNYPDYKKAPEALFLMAFTYENDVAQPKIAEKYYNKFLELHPEHKLVSEVKTVINNLGKSPEDLIKSFQKKANQ